MSTGTAPTAPSTPAVAPKTNVSGVSSYITGELSKDNSKASKEKDTRPKFIIYLTPETKDKLEALKIVAGVGKIELASRIFEHALNDACSAAIAKGKMTADFQPVGAEKKDESAK